MQRAAGIPGGLTPEFPALPREHPQCGFFGTPRGLGLAVTTTEARHQSIRTSRTPAPKFRLSPQPAAHNCEESAQQHTVETLLRQLRIAWAWGYT